MENLKPEEQHELASLPNNSNDAPPFKDNEDEGEVKRGTFVHGFSSYQKRERKSSEAEQFEMKGEDDFTQPTLDEPKMFNPTIIQSHGSGQLLGSADSYGKVYNDWQAR